MNDPAVKYREPVEGSLLVALIAGWCVPGLGHIYFGKYLRGTICMAGILALFTMGLILCGGQFAFMSDYPFYLTGKVGSGLVLFLHPVLSESPAVLHLDDPFYYFETGLLFISLSGFLNALSLMNLFDVREGRYLSYSKS